jgi:hypothetical protein
MVNEIDRRAFVSALAAPAAMALVPTLARAAGPGVEVRRMDEERRVDVLVDGQPFTSYLYPTTLQKPVLFPLRSAKGTVVTRGFPLAPRPGERVDHPHHVGLWFNHGDVDGFDFWNNSDAIPDKDKPKMGTIVHRGITAARSGSDQGELAVSMDWIRGDGKAALAEETRFLFAGGPGQRRIDRLTRLTANDAPVVFRDSKEAMLGIRVARALEAPSNEPLVFTDANGRPASVPVLDNSGVTGVYETSEGKTGDAAWGTRGRWAALRGTVEGEAVTIAILDHPKNPGYPTYWHARGYGLFAANPLGVAAFTNGKEALNFTVKPGETATFRYRVLVRTGSVPTAELEAETKRFAADTP